MQYIPLHHHHRWEAYMSRLLIALLGPYLQDPQIKSTSCLGYITLLVSFPVALTSGRAGQEFPDSSATEFALGAAQDVCLSC